VPPEHAPRTPHPAPRTPHPAPRIPHSVDLCWAWVGARPGLGRVSGRGLGLLGGYFKMLATRAIASPMVSRAIADCRPIAVLAWRVIGIVSVGLNAVALVRLR